MKTTFRRIITEGGLEMHGLLYEPKKKTNSVLLHIHGWTGNFYENHFLDYIAQKATLRNIAFYSFNNRGAGIVTDFIKRKKDKFTYQRIGGSSEIFEDCIYDIKVAVEFLEKEGYKNIILEGHSLGCQKALFYKYKTKDSRIKRIILLSPVDDVSYVKRLLGVKYLESLKIARKIISTNKNKPIPKWMEFFPAMTAERFLDVASSGTLAGGMLYFDGELEKARNVKCPMLAIFGSKDNYESKPKQALKILSGKIKNCDTILIEEADHWFTSKEEELSKSITDWI